MADAQSGQVQLTDLQVIQQFSLAVRGASADREAVVAALEADLAWLTGGTAARARTTGTRSASSRAAAPKATPGATPRAKSTRARKA